MRTTQAMGTTHVTHVKQPEHALGHSKYHKPALRNIYGTSKAYQELRTRQKQEMQPSQRRKSSVNRQYPVKHQQQKEDESNSTN